MKLYIAHVGFYDNTIGMYELHSNILVAAVDAKDAKEKVKKSQLFINKKMHIDGLMEVSTVDGYTVELVKTDLADDNQNLNYNQVKQL